MGRQAFKAATSKIAFGFVVASLLIAMGPFGARAAAAQIQQRSITISSNQAGATGANYNLAFTIATAGTLGSIEVQFCSNSPLTGDICTAPGGFDISGATLTQQNGQSGFSVSGSTTANDLILTRPPAAAGISAVSYELSGVTNPAAGGALFARVFTYASSNATGPLTDEGGLALEISGALSVSAEVPPYLLFCLGGSIAGFDCTTASDPFSDLGDLTPILTKAAQTQVVVATNAGNGYAMWTAGTTMTSGNNTINAMSVVGPSVKGASQFGMNLRANTNPAVGQDPQGPGLGTPDPNFNLPNQFFFHSGDQLASSTAPDDYRKYTVSYIVNVPANQPGGVYSTTLTYVCLANF
jgi:hypothetical protein